MLQEPAAAWHTLVVAVGVAQGYVVAQIIRIVAFGGASFRHIPGHGSRHVAMCRAPKGRAEERRQIQKKCILLCRTPSSMAEVGACGSTCFPTGCVPYNPYVQLRFLFV